MNLLTRIALVLFILGTIAFNVGLVDVRLDEIKYLIGKITVDQDITKTFGIVAKYELIKRRIQYGEDDIKNFELEARVSALTDDAIPESKKERFAQRFLLEPVRCALNIVRFSMGQPRISTLVENPIVKVVELGYFWERNRRYSEAIKIYSDIIGKTGVDPEVMAAVMAHKAFCHSMLSEYDISKSIYEQVINAYPSTQAGILSWKLLDFIQNMEKERADLASQTLSDFEKARQYYLLMDYRNAIKYFSTFMQNPVDSLVAAAAFYKGRSHEELGEIDEAVAEYYKVMRTDATKEFARQANRRMVMLGDFYDQKKQLADEAKKQLAAYQDQGFMTTLNQLSEMVSQNSLRRDLLNTDADKGPRPKNNDSLLKIINQIGYLDLSGEEDAKKQEELEKIRNEMIATGKLSVTDVKELERTRDLKDNPYRRPTAIKKVIDENSQQLRYLYNKKLRAGATFAGKMDVEIKIGSDGTVKKVRTISSNLGETEFEESVLERVRAWTFIPVPDSLGDLTVNYPFEFSSEE